MSECDQNDHSQRPHYTSQEIIQLQRINKRQKNEITDLKSKYSILGGKYTDQQKEIDEIKFTVKELAVKNIRAKFNISKTLTERKYSDHTRVSRKKPIRIDIKTNMDQKMCSVCGNKLSKIIDKYIRTVEDIIPAKMYNTKYPIYRRYCKHCKKTIKSKIYTALPNSKFGIKLGISYVKISQLVNTMYLIHVRPLP